MQRVVMLNFIMPNVVMLSVVAPYFDLPTKAWLNHHIILVGGGGVRSTLLPFPLAVKINAMTLA